ncbi:hypothetical protein [Agitococcus lubricus]|uniref:Uncharacterized protein n=1 Tax=Agitococcus lubricus TaxID=1077255 RepID=A0A2T5IS99_9GAMM|nr:hypothetical protein [Agitococcus lubricus]PTQ86698.1 hypothetical protein C8N29_13611 [Agitococcus lubricus]
MNVVDIVIIGIRFFCIWLATYSLLLLFSSRGVDSQIDKIFFLISFACMIVSILSWRFSKFLSLLIVPAETHDKEINIKNSDNLTTSMIIIIGLFLLSEAIPEMVVFFYLSSHSYYEDLLIKQSPSFVKGTVQLILGFIFLFNSRSINNRLK